MYRTTRVYMRVHRSVMFHASTAHTLAMKFICIPDITANEKTKKKKLLLPSQLY